MFERHSARDPGGEFIGLVFIWCVGGVECEGEGYVCANVVGCGVWGVRYGVEDGVRSVCDLCLWGDECGVGFVVRYIKAVDA